MKEIACQFGEHLRLTGIFTPADSSEQKQALVLISAGLVAKSGPFRMYTSIARRAAKLGFNAFRFDLGDIGHSQPGSLHLSLKHRTQSEIKAALDYLHESFGIEQFILGGLCSGGEDSYRFAEEDERVVGVIMIDPFAYRTRGFKIRNVITRVWRKCLRVILYHQSMRERSRLPDEDVVNFINYKHLEKEDSEKILLKLMQRKVALHFLYTDGKSAEFNHHSQLIKMFPELKLYPMLSLDHLPTIGHTQMLQEERNLLFQAIDNGLLKHFKTN